MRRVVWRVCVCLACVGEYVEGVCGGECVEVWRFVWCVCVCIIAYTATGCSGVINCFKKTFPLCILL